MFFVDKKNTYFYLSILCLFAFTFTFISISNSVIAQDEASEEFYDEDFTDEEEKVESLPEEKIKTPPVVEKELKEYDLEKVKISKPDEVRTQIECFSGGIVKCSEAGYIPVNNEGYTPGCIGGEVTLLKDGSGKVESKFLGKVVSQSKQLYCIQEKPVRRLDYIVGNFGDGKDSVFVRYEEDPNWYIYKLNSRGQFDESIGPNWSNNGPWPNILKLKIKGVDHLLGQNGAGIWWITNPKGGQFENINIGPWTQIKTKFIFPGDFNGDDEEDFIGITNDGRCIVSYIKDYKITNKEMKISDDFKVYKAFSLDVNADGMYDVVLFDDSGKIISLISTGEDFTVKENLGQWQEISKLTRIEKIDLDLNGKMDLVGFNRKTGKWYGLYSLDETFEEKVIIDLGAKYDWIDPQVGYFDSNENPDFLTRLGIGNYGWLLSTEYNKDKFQSKFWFGSVVNFDNEKGDLAVFKGAWDPRLEFSTFTGDFDGNGISELAAFKHYEKGLIYLPVSDHLNSDYVDLR